MNSTIMSDLDEKGAAGCFTTTKWTLVITAMREKDSAAAASALEAFCQQYRDAIYGFIRRRGYSHERAEDLVQEFLLSKLLEKWQDGDSFVHRAQRERGKFRAFLSHVVIRFLQDRARTEGGITAGGKAEHLSVEALAETGQVLPGEVEAECGREFDLAFAQAVIAAATRNLKHADHHLAVLKRQRLQADVAKEVGLSEEAFRVSHLRFRQRFGEALRQEVQNYAGDDDREVDEEIRYLMSLFARLA